MPNRHGLLYHHVDYFGSIPKTKRREGEVNVSDELFDQVKSLPRQSEQLFNLVGRWRILVCSSSSDN